MSNLPAARLGRRAAVGLAVATLFATGLTACATEADNAAATVRGYLEALARGDAAAALAFGSGQPSGPMLTDEALATALA